VRSALAVYNGLVVGTARCDIASWSPYSGATEESIERKMTEGVKTALGVRPHSSNVASRDLAN